MTRISIAVHGAEIVRKGLENLSADIPKIGREQIYKTALQSKTRMQEYPPELPGQRYVRTFRLKAGWYVQAAGEIGYRLGNNVPYTARVVGNAYGQGQAPVHVGRWQLLRDVVGAEVARLRSEVQGHIRLAINRNNL